VYENYDLILSRYPYIEEVIKEAIDRSIEDRWAGFIQSLVQAGEHLFVLGSPAYLVVTDNFGRRAGFVEGEAVNEIPGASVKELGGIQAVYVPNDLAYCIETTGVDTGSMSLNMVVTGIGEEAKVVSYEGISISPGFKICVKLDPAGPDFTMSVDVDADGVVDETRTPDSIIRAAEALVTTPPTGGALRDESVYAYPNPFNPEEEAAKIRFSLSESGKVIVKLYDAGGNLVRTLMEDESMEGKVEQSVKWDGRNEIRSQTVCTSASYPLTRGRGQYARLRC